MNAHRSSLVITQNMLASLYNSNPSPAASTACELAIAILIGCRIEPGPIRLVVETDSDGYQRLALTKS